MPGRDDEAARPEPERVVPDRPSDRESVQGSGRAVERGYELVTSEPPPTNTTAPSGDGPPVDLPSDPPPSDE